ncbi:MAG TPA: DUF4340 domain-containing protein [Allocoleopsis sp.]
MKLKPTTFFLILAALLLGGVAVLVAQSPDPTAQQTDQAAKPLFSFKPDDVKTLSLENRSNTYKFERDAQNKWQMVAPEKATASDPSIAFLLDLLATGKSNRTLSAAAADKPQFGFDKPLATIEVTLKNQETHKLILGSYDFNRSFIYALVDPPTDEKADLSVALVSPNFENAIKRPPEEWRQPAASPSPEASPSASPSESSSSESSPASPSPESPAAESSPAESPPAETVNPEEQSSPAPAEVAPSEPESSP